MISAKINSGLFGGRVLILPPQTITRAVSSKVRASIFNKLEARGKSVLDLFAGGGTLGLEALSHGAREVTFVDISSLAIKAIRQNVMSLGVADSVSIIKSDAMRYIGKNPASYDIVFLDPPYKEFSNALVKSTSNLVQLDGILVISCSSKFNLEVPMELSLLDQKDYGDTKIAFFKKIK